MSCSNGMFKGASQKLDIFGNNNIGVSLSLQISSSRLGPVLYHFGPYVSSMELIWCGGRKLLINEF